MRAFAPALLLVASSALGQVPFEPPNSTMCSSGPPSLEEGGCVHVGAELVVGYVGDVREFNWAPASEDLYRRADLVYFVEIREFFTGSLEVTRQTLAGEERLLWTPQIAGHYFVRVRACDPRIEAAQLNPATDCSDFAQSIDASNLPTAWIYFARLKPPTNGGIE